MSNILFSTDTIRMMKEDLELIQKMYAAPDPRTVISPKQWKTMKARMQYYQNTIEAKLGRDPLDRE